MRRKQAGPSWGSQAQGFPPSHPVSGDRDDDDDGTDSDELTVMKATCMINTLCAPQ